jgi:hypothetical protein
MSFCKVLEYDIKLVETLLQMSEITKEMEGRKGD